MPGDWTPDNAEEVDDTSMNINTSLLRMFLGRDSVSLAEVAAAGMSRAEVSYNRERGLIRVDAANNTLCITHAGRQGLIELCANTEVELTEHVTLTDVELVNPTLIVENLND